MTLGAIPSLMYSKKKKTVQEYSVWPLREMIHKTWLDEKSTQPHHVRVRISEPMFAKGKAESKRSHMNNLQRAEETHPGADHLSILYGHFDLFSTHCEVRPVLIERPMMHSSPLLR
jgi:hypothetical protein